MAKGNIQVSVADLGKALVGGNIGFDDVKDFQNILGEKQLNRLKSLKSYQTLNSLKETVEHAVSERTRAAGGGKQMRSVRNASKNVFRSIIAPDGSLAIENALGNDQDKYSLADLPMGRRDRKLHNRIEATSPEEVMDLLAEEAVVTNVEAPWWCESCMSTPSCQRICYPAEYATRHKNKGDGEEAGHGEHGEHGKDKSHHHGVDAGEQNFGLPDFTQAGFALEDDEDHHWPDMLVPNMLGLVQAIHRKTSIQRLCFIKEKHELPNGVGPKEVRNLVRQLQRCDHANCLYLHEALEDAEHLYFMYEHFPCVTLLSMLETHTWGQEEMVQIFRECCAATAHAATCGLLHLSWTLCHILIPVSRVKQPLLTKVFGFGLMGVVLNDSPTRICWSPECLERYHQAGAQGGFLQKVEVTLRPFCDSWSLGTIVYSLVSRRPPAMTEQQAQSKVWQFTLAIDDVDPEAKSLIEGLMDPSADRRTPASKALHHEWIRRRWRPPPGASQVYQSLEEFCTSPLAKRLFGRFLARFLDSQHMLQVANAFSSLDLRGSGTLNLKELQIAARNIGRPTSSAVQIFDWLSPNGAGEVSLSRFAETMAEDVIDGRALRHAFESLDDDGSEQISPQELWDELVDLDDSLTMEDVLQHIEDAEGEVEGRDADEDASDHAIDYSEFIQLFPVRVKRINKMKDRFESARQSMEHLAKAFSDVQPLAERWIRTLDQTVLTIQDLASKAVDNRNEQAPDAARSLKKYFVKVDECLKAPPGPADAAEMVSKFKGNKKKNVSVFGFDSFIQDCALLDNWNTLVSLEMKSLKSALIQTSKVGAGIDAWKAHDAADGVALKINDLLKKVKAQMEEYTSFSEVLSSPEALMAAVNMSGRGLKPRHGEDEDDLDGDGVNDVAPSLEDGLGAFITHYARALTDKCTDILT